MATVPYEPKTDTDVALSTFVPIVRRTSTDPLAPEADGQELGDASNLIAEMETLLDTEAATETAVLDEQAAWDAERELRFSRGIDWPTVIWIGLLHVGALAAPFFFSWEGLGLAVVFAWLTGCIGITLGYHRLFTHRSFATQSWMRYLIAWIGGLAGEGSCLYWVANHRKHHAMSDHVGDPHSPLEYGKDVGFMGWLWAHALWLMPTLPGEQRSEFIKKWVPDLAKDDGLIFLDNTFILWHLLLGAVMAGVGYWWGGLYMATSLVVWGMFVRLVYVLHITWFVNSATHMWGYRNYETSDESTNLWWVAVVAFGEGWHNNHHAYPRMANHGHQWWEFDLTYNTIRVMKLCGLAWDVVDYKSRAEKAE